MTAKLTADLGRGKNAAHPLFAVVGTLFHHQTVLASEALESLDDVADPGAEHVLVTQHVQLRLRRHDVLHQHIAERAAAALQMLQRFFTENIAGGDEAGYPSVVVHYQQQPHTAGHNALIGEFDAGVGGHGERHHLPKIGHDGNGRAVNAHALKRIGWGRVGGARRQAGVEKSCVGLSRDALLVRNDDIGDLGQSERRRPVRYALSVDSKSQPRVPGRTARSMRSLLWRSASNTAYPAAAASHRLRAPKRKACCAKCRDGSCCRTPAAYSAPTNSRISP